MRGTNKCVHVPIKASFGTFHPFLFELRVKVFHFRLTIFQTKAMLVRNYCVGDELYGMDQAGRMKAESGVDVNSRNAAFKFSY